MLVSKTWTSPVKSLSVLIALWGIVGCKPQREAHGEVSRNWRPVEATGIKDVPVAAVVSAIQQRLTGKAPAPITADQWKHVKLLYKAFPSGPLWLDTKGLEQTRGGALLHALASADSDALDLSQFPLGVRQAR